MQVRRHSLRVYRRSLTHNAKVLGTFHDRFLEFVPLTLLRHDGRARVTEASIVLGHLRVRLDGERLLSLKRANILRVCARARPVLLRRHLHGTRLGTGLLRLDHGSSTRRHLLLLLPSDLLQLFLRQFKRISAASIVKAAANDATLACGHDSS